MKIITNCFNLFFCFLFFCSCTKEVIKNDLGDSFRYEPTGIASGVIIGDVYSTNNFASFTDLTYYNNAWYIIFRTGTQHLGGLHGQIKILKSTDGITWQVERIIVNDTLDLRDPKFIVDTPKNQLYLSFAGAKNLPNDVNYRIYNFMVTYHPDSSYNNPEEINIDDNIKEKFAFWRYTYHKGRTYSASFRVPLLGGYTTDDVWLFNDNNNFKKYSAIGKINLGESPNETTIRFNAADNMYLLIRRETAHVALGISEPSDYSKVKWVDDPLKIRLSSPNFLFYKDKLLICGRDQDKLTFKFFSYNLSTAKVEKEFTFPSGVETGYGGMSFNPANSDELLISYYVISHEKSYIKLVRIDLKTFLQ